VSSGYWFKRRRYGYGWIPVTWQGWLVVGVYLVVVVAGGLAILDAPESVQPKEIGFYLLFVAIATVGLVQITLRKGPRPRWRWGRKPEDNSAEDF
jgi:hypothetical protein